MILLQTSLRIRRPAPALVMFALAAVWLCGCGRDQTPPAVKSPVSTAAAADGRDWNVLLVSVDTTRADHLGCYGHPVIKTPNIDAFAKEGTLFAQCISSAPLTLPSHATMLTGSYQFVHGARDNGSFTLGDENETLAETLAAEGFTTHAEVAAPVLNHTYRLDQGFMVYGDLLNRDPLAVRADDESEDERPPGQRMPASYITRPAEDITQHGVEFLRTSGSERFFLFLHYFDPHLPHTAPTRFAERYQDPYLAEIAYFDEQFGVLLDELRAQHLEESTLVILTSDHGEGRGQHGEPTHSFFLYDTTLHVPLILRAPGRVPAQSVSLSQVGLVDIAATVLDFLGLPPTPQMQGVSLLPLMSSSTANAGHAVYSETLAGQFIFGYAALRSLRADGWKYIHAPTPELYDLRADARELFNLAAGEPQRVAQMRTQLQQLIANAPPPPGSRAERKRITADERARLAALGYITGDSDAAIDELAEGDELDHFEPSGANPRDKLEVIQLLSGGLGLLLSGKYVEAEQQYRKLLELEPENARAHKELADALASQSKFDEALAEYRRALELNPADVAAQAGVGMILALRGEYEAAERQFRDAIAGDPSNSGPHAGLANLLGEVGRFNESLLEYAAAAELAPNNYEIFLKWGKALRELGQNDAAEEKVRQAVHLDPTVAQSHVLLANILWDGGRREEAIDELLALLDAHPEDAGLLRRIGEWRMRMDDAHEAIPYFERAAKIDTEVPQAHYNLGVALLTAEQPTEALVQFRRAVELDPEYVRGLTDLGQVLEQLGEIDEALVVYRRLAEIAPDFPHAYVSIAAMLRQRGDDAGVVRILNTGLERMPDDLGIANDLAWQLATSDEATVRDGDRAVKLAEQVNDRTGNANPGVLDTLAAAYAEVGRFEDAAGTLKRAIELATQTGADERAARLRTRLELYESGRPYRAE